MVHVEEKQHEIGSLALQLACCSKQFAAPANTGKCKSHLCYLFLGREGSQPIYFLVLQILIFIFFLYKTDRSHGFRIQIKMFHIYFSPQFLYPHLMRPILIFQNYNSSHSVLSSFNMQIIVFLIFQSTLNTFMKHSTPNSNPI